MKKIAIGFLICIIAYSCNSGSSNGQLAAIKAAQQALAQERVNFERDSLKRTLNNTWTIFYGSSTRSLILNIVSTPDAGCAFTSSADIEVNDGMQIIKKRVYKLHKVDSLGNHEWAKEISDWTVCFTNIGQNNYFLATSKKFQLYDNDGTLQLEKDISLSGNFKLHKAYCFNENEIILVGEWEERGIIVKLDMQLNIIASHIFGNEPARKYYSDGSYDVVGSPEYSQINSIIKFSNGDFYFTGKKKENLWIGKVNGNLDVVWDKSDYNYESNGNWLKGGNTIVGTKDDGLVIASSNSNTNFPTILVKIDVDGKVIWRKTFKGQISDVDISLAQVKNDYYLITFDSKENESSLLYSRLFKVKQNGDVEKESTIKVGGNDILAFHIINNNEKGFFVYGSDRNRNDKNGGFANKAIISKFNSNGIIGDNRFDYTEEESGNTLTINLDFNDNQQLAKFFNIYDFHCYIKNGYTTVMSFNPNEDINTGTITFTMFLIKKSGGFDIVSSQTYKYSVDKSKSTEKLYFNTNMQGEIYLEKDGTLIMDDVSRNEHYIYNYSKR
jgi:hypothetical protein